MSTVVFGKTPMETKTDNEVVYGKPVVDFQKNKSTSNGNRPSYKTKNRPFSDKRKKISANDARNGMKASKNSQPLVEPSSKKKKVSPTEIFTFEERLAAGRLHLNHGASDAGELFRFVVSMTGRELFGRISEDRNMSLIVSAIALSRVT